ncbi:MAG: BglG family transcription antiterminator [Lactococcus sp.]
MKRRDVLVDFLKNQPIGLWFSGNELSQKINVTDRSIRNYVKQINDETENLILIDKGYYQYNHEKDKEAISADTGDVKSRRFAILRKLLHSGYAGVNLFDLSEQFWVSESTIRGDILYLNNLSIAHHLKIHQQAFNYYIVGADSDKRNLMIESIKLASGGSDSFNEELQKLLGDISLSELTELVKLTFGSFHFYVNQYFMQNFILHLVLAITQQNQVMEEGEIIKSSEMISQLCQSIYDKYGVEISEEEKVELALLCESERNNSNEIYLHIDEKIILTLNRALKKLSDVYFINFTEDKFIKRLLLHVQNLYHRAKIGTIKRNLSARDIKMNYPVLFDIAIYLSEQIASDLSIKIIEDEIAFIALHIGSFLDEQDTDKKIHALLESPGYLEDKESFALRINEKIKNELVFDAINADKAEIIISSNLTKSNSNEKTIEISAFLTDRDITKIRRKIEEIKNRQYRDDLQVILSKLIEDNCTIKVLSSDSKESVIEKISQWFITNNFVNDDFKEKILEREEISSTAFPSGVAIPHTIKYEAQKTKILIVRPEQDILWDEQKVKLIVALAISPDEVVEFNSIFPRLVEILVENYHVSFLKSSKNAEEFTKRLIDLMCEDGYHG